MANIEHLKTADRINHTNIVFNFDPSDSDWESESFYTDEKYSLSPEQVGFFNQANSFWANLLNSTSLSGAPATSTVNVFKTGIQSPTVGLYHIVDRDGSFIEKAEIALDVGQALSTSEGFNTAMHELGHFYGLEDIDEIAAGYDQRMTIMSYNTFSDGNGNPYWAVTPMVMDIEAIRQMYNVTPVADNVANVFDETTRFDGSTRMQTIWDNGGDDTIDLSHFTTNSRIDLREALDAQNNFVDARTVVGNEIVYIAKGTIIENAIGGIGNDTIIGNGANNQITGGGGNDSLEGGSGTDTYIFTSSDTGSDLVSDDTGILKIDGVTLGGGRGSASEGSLASGIALDPEEDGTYTLGSYTLQMSGTSLVLNNGTQSITLTNFQSGDYGITLGGSSLQQSQIDIDQTYAASTDRYVIRYVPTSNTYYYQYESAPMPEGGVFYGYAPDIEYAPGLYAPLVRPMDVTGTSGNDYYSVGSYIDRGNTTISTGAGNDIIVSNKDRFYTQNVDAGADRDFITTYGGKGTVNGGDGDDQFVLYNVGDVAAETVIQGGAGRDMFFGVNAASISGGSGTDTWSIGNFGVYGSSYPFAYRDNAMSLNVPAGTFAIAGTSYTVTFDGIEVFSVTSGNGDDYIILGAGNDTVSAWWGNNTIDGGAGNDSLSTGNSETSSAFADDLINGGDGNDTISSMQGRDTLNGGDGNDSIVFLGNASVHGGEGDDVLGASFGTRSLSSTLYGDAGNDTIYAGNEADLLFGGDGDDYIYDSAGNDVIDGGEGNDYISDTVGANIIDGGEGNDTVNGSGTILGGNGDDVLSAYGELGNYFDGGEGNDTIISSAGANSTLIGGNGNDYIVSYSNALIFGHSGDDVIYLWDGDNTVQGGEGSDTIMTALGNAGNNSIDGGTGNDFIIAGSGDDSLSGGDGADQINDWQGANLLHGDGGDDSVIGSGSLYGDDGDDYLAYATENNNASNYYSGGEGNDFILVGLGNSTIDGGNGNDILSFSNASSGLDINLATGTASNNTAAYVISGIETVYGSGYADTIVGRSSADSLDGGAGDDIIRGGAGADTIRGGDGIDTLDYTGSSAAVTINLLAGTASGGDATGDSFSGFENITGSSFNDSLIGDAGNNVLTGGSGHDTLEGGAGADTLIGGDGFNSFSYNSSNAGVTVNLATGAASGGHATGDVFNGIANGFGSNFADSLTGNAGTNALYGQGGDDTIDGGDGNDTIRGGDGADSLIGGNGIDTLTYAGASSGIAVNLASGVGSAGEANGDTVSGFENIIGTSFADTITGDTGNNSIDGGLANDWLDGSSGNDTLNGGDGNDTIIGGAGADAIIGGNGIDTVSYANATASVTLSLATGGTAGDASGDTFSSIENVIGSDIFDVIEGNSGNNYIDGGAGSDFLQGNAGNDTLHGAAGADRFYFGTGHGVDIIDDFEGAGVLGGDVIRLVGLGYTAFNSTLTSNISYDFTNGIATIFNGVNGMITVHGVTTAFTANDFQFS